MTDRARPARRASGLAAAWLLACGFGLASTGCAVFKPEESPALASAPAQAVAPADAAASAADSTPVAYRLEIDASGDLRKMLQTHLDLARFQTAPQTEGITNAELIRLTNASPSQARQLLETEGYFNSKVTVARQDPEDETPLITLTVDTGPRTTVGSWELAVEGDLRQAADAGGKDALALVERLRKDWALQSGEVFRQSAWNGAKNGTLAQLRAEGYPTASTGRTEASVDARTNQARLSMTVDSGPLFLLGELRIEGLKRYEENAIRNVADFSPGTPYSEKRLLDFQERLAKLGLFESVSVEIDPATDTARATPVFVRVREQTLQQAQAGVGFSDNTRERFTLEHRHRRPFGLDLQAHNKIELGRNLRFWEGDLLSDPGPDRYRKLLAGGVTRLDTTDDTTLSWHVRAGRSLDTERIERLIYGEYLSATVTNGLGEHTSQALSANYNWTWREVDNIILPTRGLTSVIQVAGGFARSNDDANGPFSRLYTRNTLYWPLGNSWFSQVRAEFGEVFAQADVGIPDPLLFRGGGDDSVRGYSYRELGPRKNGVLTSGRKLLTGSVEIAHPFTSRQPAIWWAAFVDAGNAVDQWADYTPALGYGLGVRWRSPVGPLRIDWAYGQETHKARVHFSVGIAF